MEQWPLRFVLDTSWHENCNESTLYTDLYIHLAGAFQADDQLEPWIIWSHMRTVAMMLTPTAVSTYWKIGQHAACSTEFHDARSWCVWGVSLDLQVRAPNIGDQTARGPLLEPLKKRCCVGSSLMFSRFDEGYQHSSDRIWQVHLQQCNWCNWCWSDCDADVSKSCAECIGILEACWCCSHLTTCQSIVDPFWSIVQMRSTKTWRMSRFSQESHESLGT